MDSVVCGDVNRTWEGQQVKRNFVRLIHACTVTYAGLASILLRLDFGLVGYPLLETIALKNLDEVDRHRLRLGT